VNCWSWGGSGAFGNKGEARAERHEFLQKDHEVKKLHPPPDAKVAVDIAGEHGIDGPGEFEPGGGLGDDFDKFMPVPR